MFCVRGPLQAQETFVEIWVYSGTDPEFQDVLVYNSKVTAATNATADIAPRGLKKCCKL